MPGVTIKKPRVNFLLEGRRTALIVCQTISIAMTVVFPAPVASFRARRRSSGLASLLALAICSIKRLPIFPAFGATSVSQMAVSTASTWQKNGRMSLNLWWRQCWSRRTVSGVTFQSFRFGRHRHLSTWWRISLIIEVGSYCCLAVEMSVSTKSCCWCAFPLRFLGLGIGVMNFALRRISIIRCVGCPYSSSSQCLSGYSYGELRTGCSKNRLSTFNFSPVVIQWAEAFPSPPYQASIWESKFSAAQIEVADTEVVIWKQRDGFAKGC